MDGTYRFGPFELDAGRGLLLRDGEPLKVPHRHIAMLALLVSRAGQLVTKDELFHAGWAGEATGDNSIAHAIWTIRKTLGDNLEEPRFIKTQVGLGYRFIAPVTRVPPPMAVTSVAALVTPHRTFMEGHAAIDTMDVEAVSHARQRLVAALADASDSAAAHIDLATACILEFEATRVKAAPDTSRLDEALAHAETACRIDPRSGQAWSTLALVQQKSGDVADALASASKAATLDGNDWRHLLRLGFACWGEERLRAAHRLKQVAPDFAGAHWLEATVLIARRAFDAAIETLRAGAALQDAQRKHAGPFNAVGLHLLHGSVLGGLGRVDDALEELSRELARADERHLYSRECCANSWYAAGALHRRSGRCDDADRAFRRALALVPGHALARIGLAALSGEPIPESIPGAVSALDPIVVAAARLSAQSRDDEAARMAADSLAAARPGPDGWQLPIDPLVHAAAHRDAWAEPLRILHDRAA